MGEKTGRQHGIADAGRGDKQDVHFADPAPYIPRAIGLPSKRILAYLYALLIRSPSHARRRFALLEDRGVLAVSGRIAGCFLQGLVSNDVDKVGPAQARYAALLTAQGKYLHDFMMIETARRSGSRRKRRDSADLKRRLSIYRLRAKVTLDERPDLAVAAVFGDDASRRSGSLRRTRRRAAVRLGCRLRRSAARGARRALHPAARDTPPVRSKEPVSPKPGFDAYDRLRLALGIPDGSRDLVLEKSILLEAGFDELNGVDWQKGCYIGQELTARTKYRGLIKKRLMPVAIDGPAPAPGTIVTADGREVGEMRSSRDGLGLALLRIEPVARGQGLLKAGTATGRRVEHQTGCVLTV